MNLQLCWSSVRILCWSIQQLPSLPHLLTIWGSRRKPIDQTFLFHLRRGNHLWPGNLTITRISYFIHYLKQYIYMDCIFSILSELSYNGHIYLFSGPTCLQLPRILPTLRSSSWFIQYQWLFRSWRQTIQRWP